MCQRWSLCNTSIWASASVVQWSGDRLQCGSLWGSLQAVSRWSHTPDWPTGILQATLPHVLQYGISASSWLARGSLQAVHGGATPLTDPQVYSRLPYHASCSTASALVLVGPGIAPSCSRWSHTPDWPTGILQATLPRVLQYRTGLVGPASAYRAWVRERIWCASCLFQWDSRCHCLSRFVPDVVCPSLRR